jgi:hypothetical protein
MTPRRRETITQQDQPVRFYKAVALLFLFATIVLLGVILFMSAKRAVITIEAKTEPVSVSCAVEVSHASALPGSVSSTVVTVSDIASPAGGKDIDGVAIGNVTLHNDTDASQALIATTRLLTPEGVLFRLKARADIPARGTTDADVYADAAGATGNIGPARFTIPGLSADKQAVIYGTSDAPMAGGTRRVGVMTIEDRKDAEKRMTDRLLEEGKKRFAGESAGRAAAYGLMQYSVVVEPEVNTETDEIRTSGSGTIVAVFYDGEALHAFARELLARQAVDEHEIVQPQSEDPAVSVRDADVSRGQATLEVFFGGLATLNPEGSSLKKEAFFGKNRDEIHRHVLSLDHVQGVSVDFSPAWMMRVPYSADNVHIVVKQVQ